ncbi:unnamed protein product [Arctia plantaginis]|uniref:Uncharacterized protein n=1 Tax=Arctia plantaginis TaxID=874455 RepID=A0A8S0ZDG4_ARCPL|nr:unnamed protein product [Arctia plantaginis]
MAAKFVVLVALVAVAHCSVVPVVQVDADYNSFAYDVADPNTGDYKSQVESRVGGNVVGSAMASKLVVLVALVAVAHCSVVPVVQVDADSSSFSYDVADPNTGDYKSQVESRVGGNVVGSVMTVKFVVLAALVAVAHSSVVPIVRVDADSSHFSYEDPAVPVVSVVPVEPESPVGPAVTSEPISSVEPANSVKSASPVGPAVTAEPISSVEPANSVKSASPVKPVASVAPVNFRCIF